MTDAERIDELETRAAFQAQAIDDLHEALVGQHKTIAKLEEEVSHLREAVRRLARGTDEGGEVLGAFPEQDPVPHSG